MIYDIIIQRNQKFEEKLETENKECEIKNQETANQDIPDDFIGCCSFENSSQSQQSIDRCREDFYRYINAKIPPMNLYECDLLGWWFGNRHTFPKLFRVFISLAGITTASSPSERRLSETGAIISAQRASLLPDTVSDLVLARNMFLGFL